MPAQPGLRDEPGLRDQSGLRERKKAQTRQRIADTAAALFAEHGFEEVSIVDVARAADVSEQTVYNYFPAKQDLVLDRAEAIRLRYVEVVSQRPPGTSPAAALHALASEDVERYRRTDVDQARGEFPALCVSSPNIRRFALEARDRQVETVRDAIAATCPIVHPAIVHAHAAALVAMFQMVTDHIGRSVLAGASPEVEADALMLTVGVVLSDLDHHFHTFSAADPRAADGTFPQSDRSPS